MQGRQPKRHQVISHQEEKVQTDRDERDLVGYASALISAPSVWMRWLVDTHFAAADRRGEQDHIVPIGGAHPVGPTQHGWGTQFHSFA